jgi:transposase
MRLHEQGKWREIMIRMLLVGYCYGTRSQRRLCVEANYNLAYHWFCQLGLEAGYRPESEVHRRINAMTRIPPQ